MRIITSVLMLFCLGCSSPESPENEDSRDLPTITGIRLTSNQDIDGLQGIVFGTPAYPMVGTAFDKINMYPNPYYAYNPEEPNALDRFVTFTHLPNEVTIEIYRGLLPAVAFYKLEHFTTTNNDFTPPVETIEKNNNSQFQKWQLLKPDGSFVPSGLYRAYFSTPSDGLINWVDMYIFNSADCRSWVDQTGWLPTDWDITITPNGSRISRCQ